MTDKYIAIFYNHILITDNKTCMDDFIWANYYGNKSTEYHRTVCGIMSVSNMAYPQWHPVSCNESISVDVICTDNSSSYNLTKSFSDKNINVKTICGKKYILYQNYCYRFNNKGFKNDTMRAKHHYKSVMDTYQNNHLLMSISKVSKAPINFIIENKMTQIVLQYDTFFNSFTFRRRLVQKLKMNEFFIRKAIKKDTLHVNTRNTRMFECFNGEYVSMLYWNEMNCFHQDKDKLGSICFQNGKGMDVTYCRKSCVKSDCVCNDLYYHNTQGGCLPYLRPFPKTLNFTSFNNYSKIQYTHKLSSLLYLDCNRDELSKIKKNKTVFFKSCEDPDQLLCTYGCRKCFPSHKLCTYELDYDGKLLHCPSGAHLKNCEFIGCNNMFKCPNSYCIPYRYLLTHEFIYYSHLLFPSLLCKEYP